MVVGQAKDVSGIRAVSHYYVKGIGIFQTLFWKAVFGG